MAADPPLISSRRRRVPSRGVRDPERTRRNLLDAAYREFAAAGYHGASIEKICKRAGVSKQILIHHFGSKANAHLAVLEAAYRASRAQDTRLQSDQAGPVEALSDFVAHSFDHLRANRDFVALLADENINKARHIKRSKVLGDIYAPLIAGLDAILRRGERAGVFRPGVEAMQLYVSISALCYFIFSNGHTLSAVFGRDLLSAAALAARRQHVVQFVLNAVCVEAPQT